MYPNCVTKSAAIPESVILSHPFIDGNKRTAFLLCESLLEFSGYTIVAETETMYDLLVGVSAGKLDFWSVMQWLQQNTEQTE